MLAIALADAATATDKQISDITRNVFEFAKRILEKSDEEYIILPDGFELNYACAIPYGYSSIESLAAGHISYHIRLLKKAGFDEQQEYEIASTLIYKAKRGYLKREILEEKPKSETLKTALKIFDKAAGFEDAFHQVKKDEPIASVIACALAEAYYGLPDEYKEKALMALPKDLLDIYEKWQKKFPIRHEKFKILTNYIGAANQFSAFRRNKPLRFIVSKDYEPYLSKDFLTALDAFSKSHKDCRDADYLEILEFCRRPKAKNIFNGDYVTDRLKRLKRSDISDRNSEVLSVKFGGSEIDFVGKKLIQHKDIYDNGIGYATCETQLSAEQLAEAIAMLNSLETDFWRPEYHPYDLDLIVSVGGSWGLTITYKGEMPLYWEGVNAEPKNQKRLYRFFDKFEFDPKQKPFPILSCVISIDSPPRSGIDRNDPVYTEHETLTVDYETRELTFIKYKLIDNEKIGEQQHKYALDEATVIRILKKADYVVCSDEWIKAEPITGTEEYITFTLTKQDGTKTLHARYDRSCVIAYEWASNWHKEFGSGYENKIVDDFDKILQLKHTMLLDWKKFYNAMRPNERKYCKVLLHSKETVYAPTDDRVLKIGDQVIVVRHGEEENCPLGKITDIYFRSIENESEEDETAVIIKDWEGHMIFFTSGLYFGSEDVIGHCGRPFLSVDEMDEALIENWNKTVKKTDDVYILGDFSALNADEVHEKYMSKLNGRKYIIKGNCDGYLERYDGCYRYMTEDNVGWSKDYYIFKRDHKEIVMFHYPISRWKNMENGAIHLFGRPQPEKYQGKVTLPNAYNVSADLNDYTPISLEEIVRRLEI